MQQKQTEHWNFDNPELLLAQALSHAMNFEYACILCSNGFKDPDGKYQLLAGFGAKKIIRNLQDFGSDDSLSLGFISYDYKNTLHGLQSTHPAAIGVPEVFFFEPEQTLEWFRDGRVDSKGLPEKVPGYIEWKSGAYVGDWTCTVDEKTYAEHIASIRTQIRNGDFYEMNYCTEWESAEISDGPDPAALFFQLSKTAPAPFAAFFKFGNKYLICSSPERFLAKKGDYIWSQPIKGTRRRSKNLEEDAEIKKELESAEKDRSENIMITDLVRNDLSRVCRNGTVRVDELCKIYSFSHVHQMISKISGELHTDYNFSDIIAATFPMGSMTGAPKLRVMQDIEKYENFSRGWYSGTVGWYYQGNFDLNVVIRSLQLDSDAKKMVYNVGGAIVYDSDAASEFEECKIKAAGIRAALQS